MYANNDDFSTTSGHISFMYTGYLTFYSKVHTPVSAVHSDPHSFLPVTNPHILHPWKPRWLSIHWGYRHLPPSSSVLRDLPGPKVLLRKEAGAFHQRLQLRSAGAMWVFPKIGVPPKSSILIGFFPKRNIHFGVTLVLETPMWKICPTEIGIHQEPWVDSWESLNFYCLNGFLVNKIKG